MAIKTPEVLTKDEQDRLFVQLRQVFSPDRPVTAKQLFAGRREQIGKVLNVVFHPGGMHVMIYGERGVGKTSLASVLPFFFSLGEELQTGAAPLIIRISCSSEDTLDSVWRKMFSSITIAIDDEGNEIQKTITETLGNIILTPFLIEQKIASIVRGTIILIFDEFDVIEDKRTKKLFAELIKSMSDNNVKATLILIGVGDSVNELIGEHESIERNLTQVEMPRMSAADADEILVQNGFEKVGMGIEDLALERIKKIAQGLPTYIHALGLNAGLMAVHNLRRNVTASDVKKAITEALNQAHQSIKTAYDKATASNKKNNFKQVLLACALAKPDNFGYFSPGDVRGPFRIVTKEPTYDIENFLPNLAAFMQVQRGPALQRIGEPWGYTYRFKKALLQPFVIMQGLEDGLITQEQLDILI